jgi:hypothetical protein
VPRSPRPLTPEEREALGALARFVDFDRVRIMSAPASGLPALVRRLVMLASGGRAVTLGNHIFLDARGARDSAVLAHEVTHCGQYQRWGRWRYFARGAWERLRELAHRHARVGRNPYAYRLERDKPFDAYGMEEQGQIVEDCFRGDPAAQAVCPYHPGTPAG